MYVACICNKHGPIDVEKGWIGLIECGICVCVCVCLRCEIWWIFSSCFSGGVVWLTEPQSYLMCPPQNCITRQVCYSTSCLALNKIRGYFVAQYCLLCSVLSLNMLYNDHHQFQWILLGISQKSVNVDDIFVGVGVHAVFLLWSNIWHCSLNANMRQLSDIAGH